MVRRPFFNSRRARRPVVLRHDAEFIAAREASIPVQLSEKMLWAQDPALWSPVTIAGLRPLGTVPEQILMNAVIDESCRSLHVGS